MRDDHNNEYNNNEYNHFNNYMKMKKALAGILLFVLTIGTAAGYIEVGGNIEWGVNLEYDDADIILVHPTNGTNISQISDVVNFNMTVNCADKFYYNTAVGGSGACNILLSNATSEYIDLGCVEPIIEVEKVCGTTVQSSTFALEPANYNWTARVATVENGWYNYPTYFYNNSFTALPDINLVSYAVNQTWGLIGDSLLVTNVIQGDGYESHTWYTFDGEVGNVTDAVSGTNNIMWQTAGLGLRTYTTRGCVNNTVGEVVCSTGYISVRFGTTTTTLYAPPYVPPPDIETNTTVINAVPKRTCFSYILEFDLLRAVLCPFNSAFGGA